MPLRPSPLRLASLFIAGGLVAYAGCESSGGTAIAVTHPTMIRVEPEDFLGPVPCDPNGSGLKRYVATLVDYNYGEGGAPSALEAGEGGAAVASAGSEPGGGAGQEPVEARAAEAMGFQAPSSLPTPCSTGVGFGFVVPGRHYEVIIDGYDTDAIAPRATGSREMVSTDTTPLDPPQPEVEAALAPKLSARWTAHCRRAVAVDSTIVRAGDCETFPLESTVTTGQLRIALGSLLGALECGDQPGQVDHFELSGAGDTPQEAPCGADAQVVLSGSANERLSIYVQAVSSDGAPVAGSECSGVVKAGGSGDAQCPRLSTVGTVRVDLSAALVQLGGSCSADSVSSVTVKIPFDQSVHQFPPPDCRQPFDYGFPPGDQAFTLSTSFVEEPASRVLTCSASVEPGRLTTATCTPNTAE